MRYTNILGQTRELYGNDPDSWDFVADERNFRIKAAMTTMNIADELNDNDMFQDARTRYMKNRDNRWRDIANADELRNGYENTN